MKRAAGFSLVELMVAMTLGLIVTGAVVASFAGSRAASRSTAGVSALTDSGRFAMSTLAQGLRSAGYIACTTANNTQQTLLNVPAVPPVAYTFSQALSGYEANGTGPATTPVLAAPPLVASANAGNWIGGIDPVILPGPAGTPTNIVDGSDVVAVHTTLPGTVPAYVTNNIAPGADNMTLSTAAASPTLPYAVGQLAAISDCTKAVTFEITGVAATVLTHDAGGAAPGNASSTLPAGISFNPGAMVQLLTTTVYYIGRGADGDGALYSFDLTTAGAVPQELAPDIENMQVLYGIDTTLTGGTVTQYVTADKVPDWTAVLSVEIALLAASPPNAVMPPTVAPTFNLLGTLVKAPIDSRRRQIFTTSIALRNAVS